MAFTSWTALRDAIRDAMADGSILTKSYTIGGRTHVMRDARDIEQLLLLCEKNIAAENDDGNSVFFYPKFVRPH